MNDGLLVVGSGPAGVAAAVAYRDAGGRGPVRIVTADEHLPYDRPPLSKDLLRGETHPDDVWLHPDGFYADRDIEIVRDAPVGALDPAGTVTLDDGRRIGFATCVLATGARPVRPPVPGTDRPTVHDLRSLTEALTLREAAAKATSAVVVGSGFIGCEAAASLARRGLRVTLVTTEERPQAARLGLGGRRTRIGRLVAGRRRRAGDRRRARCRHRGRRPDRQRARDPGRARAAGHRGAAARRAGRGRRPARRARPGPGRRGDAHQRQRPSWPPGTSRWRRTPPPVARWRWSTGATR